MKREVVQNTAFHDQGSCLLLLFIITVMKIRFGSWQYHHVFTLLSLWPHRCTMIPKEINEEHLRTFSEKQWLNHKAGKTKKVEETCHCMSVYPSFYNSIYLQGGDSVIVQSGHLFPRQSVSCLVTNLKTCVELQHVQQLQRWDNNAKVTSTHENESRGDLDLSLYPYNHLNGTCIYYVLVFAGVLYLAEEVPLLLSLGEAGEVAADHQVRVIQHGIEPTPGGQQGLDTQDTMFTALDYMLTVVAKIPDF